MRENSHSGFTLIELSIVLVIIGLLVGGILVGRDLIKAAEVRAQISQIEKYKTAVNTFRLRYDVLPGDLTNDTALQLGLWTTRGTVNGHNFADGDGNGVIEGFCTTGAGLWMSGEISMFWNDLGVSQLIDGQFPNNTDAQVYTIGNGAGTLPTSSYLPQAKIGNGNYVYVWSGGFGVDYGGALGGTGGTIDYVNCNGGVNLYDDGTNYFAVSAMPGGIWDSGYLSGPGLTVTQAFAIDTKMDDGLPQTGRVIALYPSYKAWGNVIWASAIWNVGGYYDSAPSLTNTAANPGSSFTCYDNSAGGTGTPGVANAVQHYSTEINGGNGVNCALSFKFQ